MEEVAVVGPGNLAEDELVGPVPVHVGDQQAGVVHHLVAVGAGIDVDRRAESTARIAEAHQRRSGAIWVPGGEHQVGLAVAVEIPERRRSQAPRNRGIGAAGRNRGDHLVCGLKSIGTVARPHLNGEVRVARFGIDRRRPFPDDIGSAIAGHVSHLLEAGGAVSQDLGFEPTVAVSFQEHRRPRRFARADDVEVPVSVYIGREHREEHDPEWVGSREGAVAERAPEDDLPLNRRLEDEVIEPVTVEISGDQRGRGILVGADAL